MAIGDRGSEIAALRLSGATPRQVLLMLLTEACLVAGTGILLAAGVSAVTVAGTCQGLGRVAPSVHLVIPWQPVTGILLACLLIAVLASAAGAVSLLRRPPVALAGLRE
jgi:putative ABC transport system permease protein